MSRSVASCRVIAPKYQLKKISIEFAKIFDILEKKKLYIWQKSSKYQLKKEISVKMAKITEISFF